MGNFWKAPPALRLQIVSRGWWLIFQSKHKHSKQDSAIRLSVCGLLVAVVARGGDVCEILVLTNYRAFKQRRTRVGGGLGDAWAERRLLWVVLVCQVRGRLSVSRSRGSRMTGGCQHLFFLAWGGAGPRARQPTRAVRGELPVACLGVPLSRAPLDVLRAGGPAASLPAPPQLQRSSPRASFPLPP